ncbi:MAG: hypothetical protein LJE69_05165 [Thiohalocapsa sp.]|jgi:DNA-binding NtrC family response regulator|uniref:hypothetical protein n=1 Tax=Thiohalocapsa sp. TaxID=2497641 RepID=UPI0025F693C9|nr:hypothetical protein [Thiohalocapsa sp.]MCG6940622.1 hypothetical protein [Thiohalocapsa sp.]
MPKRILVIDDEKAVRDAFEQELRAARDAGLRFELARKPLGAAQIRSIVRSSLDLGDADETSEFP